MKPFLSASYALDHRPHMAIDIFGFPSEPADSHQVLHDSISDIEETTPVSDVVAHWGRIIHSFNVGRMPNTVVVFDSYYLDEAGRQKLRVKNVKFISAVNSQRFPTLSASVRHGVDRRGQWNR